MLHFAEVDYNFIQVTKDIRGLEDGVLIHCEQCVEKYLKHLSRLYTGKADSTHAIVRMSKDLSRHIPELKSHMNIVYKLKTYYHERRYACEDYYPLSEDDYRESLNQSLALIQLLREKTSQVNDSMGHTNNFSN